MNINGRGKVYAIQFREGYTFIHNLRRLRQIENLLRLERKGGRKRYGLGNTLSLSFFFKFWSSTSINLCLHTLIKSQADQLLSFFYWSVYVLQAR